MLEPEMEAYLRRLVPGIEREWQGVSKDELEELEEIAGQELPGFHRWLLTTMGHSAGALDRYLRPYAAKTILAAHAKGDVECEPPLVLVARMEDPMMTVDLLCDLREQVRDDALVLRSVAGERTRAAETLREWLGWLVSIAVAINARPQRCAGTLKEHGGDAKGQLDAILRQLGFESPIRSGPYCGIYERADAALACKVDPEPSNLDLLCFDLGGPDEGTLRRVLGEIATKTSIEISIGKWTPPLPVPK